MALVSGKVTAKNIAISTTGIHFHFFTIKNAGIQVFLKHDPLDLQARELLNQINWL